MSSFDEAQAAYERRRLGQAAERGVPVKEGLDGAERNRASTVAIRRGYQSEQLTRAERREASKAAAFEPDPRLEAIERVLASDPTFRISPAARLELGYYKEAREAARHEANRGW